MGNARLSSDGPQRRLSKASVRTLALRRQRYSLCIHHHCASNAGNTQPHWQRGAHQKCVSGQDFYSASDLETKRNRYRPRLGSHLAVRAPVFHHNRMGGCLARKLQLAAITCPIGNRSRGIQSPAQSPARCRQQDQRSRSATIRLRSALMHLTTDSASDKFLQWDWTKDHECVTGLLARVTVGVAEPAHFARITTLGKTY
jgi:hypothetical protein